MNEMNDTNEYIDEYIYGIRLAIKHNKIKLNEISNHLQLEMHNGWNYDEPRISRYGKLLPGLKPFTYWNFKKIVRDQRTSLQGMFDFLDSIEHAHDFLRNITLSGGTVWIELHFDGEINIGDVCDSKKFGKLAELGIEFGFEVFPGGLGCS